MKRVFIEHIESYMPEERICNYHVEEKIRAGGFAIQEGILEKMIVSEIRYYAHKHEQASDVAVAAAKKLVKKFRER